MADKAMEEKWSFYMYKSKAKRSAHNEPVTAFFLGRDWAGSASENSVLNRRYISLQNE